MSIVIRKKDTGEIFDIPSDFSLEINITSPIFNNIGSKSVTTSIPRTPNNSRLLGYASRLDIDAKPISKIPVIVYDSTYMRRGMMYLSSAYNTTKGYGVTIAFAEGVMYEEMKSVKLTALSGLPVIEKNYQQMKEYMDNLFIDDDLDSELTLFTITLKDETYPNPESSSSADLVNITRLNDVDPETTNTLYWPYTINIVQNNALVPVDVPGGYGVTPFVRVWYVIDRIFNHFGYKIGTNPFKEHYQLRRLCVLNNVADALVLNKIDYSQLLPDVTVIDFLTSMQCRFGMIFLVDGDSDTVNISLLKDVFENKTSSQIDVSSLPDIDYTEPKQLKLSCARSLDRSSTEKDTYAEFIKKYRYQLGRFVYDTGSYQFGLCYSKQQGLYAITSLVYGTPKIVSSVHFDWDQKADMEYEELNSVDEGLTMDKNYRIYYGISPQLLNSKLKIDSEDVEVENNSKLAFAWDMGEGYNVDRATGERFYWGYKWGSVLPYVPYSPEYRDPVYFEDKDGNIFQYALTFIGEDGCFNRFHKQYDAFLRHSNNVVKVDIDKSLYELANIDYKAKYSVDNHPLLIDKVNHILGARKTVSMELRTTRLYRPYDLNSDHALPETQPITSMWEVVTDPAVDLADATPKLQAKLIAEGQAQYPDYIFRELILLESTVIDRNPNIEGLWYLPPTEQQVIDGEKLGYGKYRIRRKFLHVYYANSQDRGDTIYIETYYYYFVAKAIPPRPS
ncbi:MULTISPECIES: hypothetical protein [Dysgonomonas]|uniref:hypothetical protein n=1 Tax=Dysgonomonas TaxID=156973 RepID=UPI000929908A|nr:MULTISPECIES: hypothetical protein [Dysgonomonas]MBN9301625.1 hypothetical protein [Dysgonomonas mossii]OJX64417.1 MAG: hypothetical protein BGO84_10180 [Dysgonomonas sp. 37-18]